MNLVLAKYRTQYYVFVQRHGLFTDATNQLRNVRRLILNFLELLYLLRDIVEELLLLQSQCLNSEEEHLDQLLVLHLSQEPFLQSYG